MSGLSISSSTLSEPRRKQILFRAWHRGTREMDLLMGRYAEQALPTLTEAQLQEFETLIDLPDRDLFAWIAEREPVPAEYDVSVFRALQAFHRHDAPIH